MKVLVVDDNEAVRQGLIAILEKMNGIQVIGQAGNGMDCLTQVNQLQPDVVFLDIEMPDMTGIQTAESLGSLGNAPLLILVSAHTEFGPEAFAVNAIDYIPKPFSPGRIIVAVNKARRLLVEKKSKRKLQVKQGSTIHIIETDDIIFVEKVGKKALIHTAERSLETYEALSRLEKMLPAHFLRTHQGYIVNIQKVKELQPFNAGSYVVHFTNFDKTALLLRSNLDLFCQLV